jgi:hypothetical protein
LTQGQKAEILRTVIERLKKFVVEVGLTARPGELRVLFAAYPALGSPFNFIAKVKVDTVRYECDGYTEKGKCVTLKHRLKEKTKKS